MPADKTRRSGHENPFSFMITHYRRVDSRMSYGITCTVGSGTTNFPPQVRI